MKAPLIAYSFQMTPALEIANPSSGEGLLAAVKEEINANRKKECWI